MCVNAQTGAGTGSNLQAVRQFVPKREENRRLNPALVFLCVDDDQAPHGDWSVCSGSQSLKRKTRAASDSCTVGWVN